MSRPALWVVSSALFAVWMEAFFTGFPWWCYAAYISVWVGYVVVDEIGKLWTLRGFWNFAAVAGWDRHDAHDGWDPERRLQVLIHTYNSHFGDDYLVEWAPEGDS
jgi:hypothetical protein